MYVANLPPQYAEKTLWKDWAQAGPIDNVSLNAGSRHSTCTVRYQTCEGAKAALAWNGSKYQGRTLKVDWAKRA